MELDKQDLERLLANDLLVIMQEETAEAFSKKEWDGIPWTPRAQDDGIGSLMTLIVLTIVLVSEKKTVRCCCEFTQLSSLSQPNDILSCSLGFIISGFCS